MYGSTISGKFFGEGGDDFLYGDVGNEVMKGGLGDDWLEGRGKQDKLFGNEGADTFAFTNADENNNPGAGFAVHRIKDFDPDEDKIFLDVGRFTAIDPGPLDASEFGVGRRAKSPDQNLVFRKKTGDLFYDEDGTGGHQEGADRRARAGAQAQGVSLRGRLRGVTREPAPDAGRLPGVASPRVSGKSVCFSLVTPIVTQT